MSGLNISECRKQLVEAYVDAEYAVWKWAKEHPEPQYPTWSEFLATMMIDGLPMNDHECVRWLGEHHVPADIAEKLGLKPEEAK